MKQIFFATIAIVFCVSAQAQYSEKFLKAMEEKVRVLDSNINTAQAWQDLANSFERIAEAEKTQWLPYYYASFATVMAGYTSMNPGEMGDHSATIDPLADKAEKLLDKADQLNKNNSDIYCIKKMIATLRLAANPMARYMTELPKAEEAINKAKELNPNNPRVYMLLGQDKFFTPEQFGGSKTEAKVLFEQAIKLFESEKPETSIHPHWGLAPTKYYYSQIQ